MKKTVAFTGMLTSAAAVLGFIIVGMFSTDISLAQDQATAVAIFTEHECQGCHSVQIAKIDLDIGDLEPDEIDEDAPDLSGVGLEHEIDWLKLYLKKKNKQNGEKHEKKFRGTDDEFEVLTNWLVSMKTEVETKK
jgi:hypothetical protein